MVEGEKMPIGGLNLNTTQALHWKQWTISPTNFQILSWHKDCVLLAFPCCVCVRHWIVGLNTISLTVRDLVLLETFRLVGFVRFFFVFFVSCSRLSIRIMEMLGLLSSVHSMHPIKTYFAMFLLSQNALKAQCAYSFFHAYCYYFTLNALLAHCWTQLEQMDE